MLKCGTSIILNSFPGLTAQLARRNISSDQHYFLLQTYMH